MKLKSMMKRLVNLLAVFILSVNCMSAQNLTRWVNPFIGTGASDFIDILLLPTMSDNAGVHQKKAYEAVCNSIIVSHPDSPFEVWEKYGYMPENIQTQSVSIILEHGVQIFLKEWSVRMLRMIILLITNT